MTKTGARSGEEVTLPRTWLQPMRLPVHGDVIQMGESQMTEIVVGLYGRLAFSLGRIVTLLKDVPWRASELAQWAKHLPQKSNVLRSICAMRSVCGPYREGRRRELTPQCCPLTSTPGVLLTIPHTTIASKK